MSLVNDALKRARQAQQPNPPPPLPTSPYQENQECALEGAPWYMSRVTMAVVVVIGIILVWQTLRRHDSDRSAAVPEVVSAREALTTLAPPAPSEEEAPPVEVAQETAPESVEPSEPAAVVVEPQPVPVAPAPALPPLRLQAVFWSPRRPSAIISGQTVFVGDTIRQQKVVSITRNSATLSGAGETQVLSVR